MKYKKILLSIVLILFVVVSFFLIQFSLVPETKKSEGKNGYYLKNNQMVYSICSKGGCRIKEVHDVDIETFVVLRDGKYAKDKNNVYWRGSVILGADVETFQPSKGDYAKDKKYGYYLNQKIEGSDGKTFEHIKYYFAKDENHIYCYGKVVEDVDFQTFEIIDSMQAKDKNRNFFCENKE